MSVIIVNGRTMKNPKLVTTVLVTASMNEEDIEKELEEEDPIYEEALASIYENMVPQNATNN